MTDEQWKAECEKMRGFEGVVLAAVPLLVPGAVCVNPCRGGSPYRLTLGGPFLQIGRDGEETKQEEFTFFDDRDLRRVAIVLGRRAREGIERGIAQAERELADLREKLEAQAKASAEVERALGR